MLGRLWMAKDWNNTPSLLSIKDTLTEIAKHHQVYLFALFKYKRHQISDGVFLSCPVFPTGRRGIACSPNYAGQRSPLLLCCRDMEIYQFNVTEEISYLDWQLLTKQQYWTMEEKRVNTVRSYLHPHSSDLQNKKSEIVRVNNSCPTQTGADWSQIRWLSYLFLK